MSYKKMLLVLTLTVILITASLLSVSYAWYGFSMSNNFTVRVEGENVTVVYAQNEYFATRIGMPITANEVDTKAKETTFTVTAGNELTDYTTAIQLAITDFQIEDALKSTDFRYQLYENDILIKDSNFSNAISETDYVLLPFKVISVGTYNYRLRVWLNETGLDQSSMMGKTLRGRIQVSSAIK